MVHKGEKGFFYRDFTVLTNRRKNHNAPKFHFAHDSYVVTVVVPIDEILDHFFNVAVSMPSLCILMKILCNNIDCCSKKITVSEQWMYLLMQVHVSH